MNVISAILVQMSAGPFSDKETQLSNRFFLLLPWRQEGLDGVKERLVIMLPLEIHVTVASSLCCCVMSLSRAGTDGTF